jgi:hypothetical protein
MAIEISKQTIEDIVIDLTLNGNVLSKDFLVYANIPTEDWRNGNQRKMILILQHIETGKFFKVEYYDVYLDINKKDLFKIIAKTQLSPEVDLLFRDKAELKWIEKE